MYLLQVLRCIYNKTTTTKKVTSYLPYTDNREQLHLLLTQNLVPRKRALCLSSLLVSQSRAPSTEKKTPHDVFA